MRIGELEFPLPLFLAPMAGVTDLAYRQVCHELGAAGAVTEMVSAKAIYYGNRGTEALLKRLPGDGPLAVQLFGSEPELMALMAARIEDRFDWIDINMGCPMPKITNNGEGSALMKDPLLAARIVSEMVKAVKKPVTVKLRKGFDGDQVNAVEVALAVQEAGAAAVTVHGRTRAQYYSGKADRGIIRAVREALRIPVIGNGDIFTAADALSMREETGCDGIMIARGCQGNPWLFREAAAALRGEPVPSRPDRSEMLAVMRRHAALTRADKGEALCYRELRKHLAWYTTGLPGGAALRKAACEIACEADLCVWFEAFEKTGNA